MITTTRKETILPNIRPCDQDCWSTEPVS